MNTNDVNDIINNGQTITGRCAQSCKKLLAGIEQAKNKIAHEFQEALASNSQLLQLALKEAEALAFQTAFPHLVFPTLAVEKIQAVSAWQARQELVRQRPAMFAENR